MTPAEAQVLLSMAAAFDNRKPDPDAAKAWAAALDGLPFEDCRAALIEHYANTTDWIMPAHITTIVKRRRAKRISQADIPPPPNPDDPAAYIADLKASRERAATGHPPPPALPPGTPPPGIAQQLRALTTKARQ